MIIRKAVLQDADGIAHVHVNSWKSTYKGIISDQVLDNLSIERRKKYWEETLNKVEIDEFIYVVQDLDGKIVGFASGGKSRSPEYPYDGELYAIYLLRDYQKLGFGRKLISNIANDLLAIDCKSMIVWVLEDNPSKNAYEKLGGIEIGSKQIEIGKDNLKEVVLVWGNTQDLL